jgi:hypothetical protein
MIARLLAAAGLSVLLAAADPPPPPALDLLMRPHASGDANSGIDVAMTLHDARLKAGEGLVHIPLTLVGIPSARYDGNALTASDDAGPLALVQSEEPPTPQGTYRRWSTTRATVGDVLIRYTAPPRRVTAATNNGPLFDLREEAGGFAGAGVGFIATPVAPGPYQVSLKWDLSRMPAGARGAWTMGDGDVSVVTAAPALAFSYYAVGPLKTIPARPDGGFAMYWLGQPPFDPVQLGDRTKALFEAMARFWGDTDPSYRVFVRQNPYAGRGGSGLGRSFMFGYNPAERPDVDTLQGLLAHEIAHKWPAMQGEHGDTAWYSEGTAEFYSLMLAHRAGLLPPTKLLEALNSKASAYYTNPYLTLTNPEAAKRFWTDPVAQTVPYGRGFLYLVQVDGQIRARSGNKRSLDDVTRALYRRQLANQPYGVAAWLELVGAELGTTEAKRGYDAMVAGEVLKLSPTRFAPCLSVTRHDERPFELGFARASLNDDRIVKDLVPTSTAAQAGVRGGDVIVSASDITKVRDDETLPMALTLRRGTQTLQLSYLPRGALREAYRWTRDPAVPDARCSF